MVELTILLKRIYKVEVPLDKLCFENFQLYAKGEKIQ